MADKENKNWEKQAIEKIALASLGEQRSSRRWGVFFKIIGLIYLGWVLFFVLSYLL